MKRMSGILPIILILASFAAGCGGGGSGDNLSPILDISQVQALVIDQMAVTGGLEDEYRNQGEYTLYLRDAATGKDLACVGAEEGMGRVAGSGIYQAGFALKLREVEADHPSSAARFKLVVVEKDGPDCPSAINSADDLVGESAELTSEQLVGRAIFTTNGKAVVVLRQESQAALDVGQMAPALADGLAIDQLSFSYEADGNAASRFYLYAERMEGDTPVAQCQVADALLEPIRFGNSLYAALGFPFACLDPTDPGFPDWKVRVGIYVQAADGPQLIGQTEARKVGDLIGEKVIFAEGEGFISFRRVKTTPFTADVVRLADVTQMTITALSHTASPATDAAVELHAVDPVSGLSLACAGAAQGLTNVAAAGQHDGLAATLSAMEEGRERFGWDQVQLQLIQRTDGKACPAMPESAPTILASTASLLAGDFIAGQTNFSSNGGSVTFVQAAH